VRGVIVIFAFIASGCAMLDAPQSNQWTKPGSRSGDMAVNPTKEKKLTNMRASGTDKNILLKPPRIMSLEMALEYIEEDELVEVTPTKIRLRKKVLKETDRRKIARQGA